MTQGRLYQNLVCKLYCGLTETVLPALVALFSEEDETANEQQLILRRILDYFYLRSTFLQSRFNYQLNYLQCTRLAYARKDGSLLNKTNVNGQINSTTSSVSSKVAVLIHGAFQGPESFSVGSHSSLRWYLHEQGYEVWDLGSCGLRCLGAAQPQESLAGGTRTPISLNDVYQHILTEHRGGALRSITWIAHSAGCQDLLQALQQREAHGAELDALRGAVQEHAILLSPITEANVVVKSSLRWRKAPCERERCWQRFMNEMPVFRRSRSDASAALSLLDATEPESLRHLQQWRDLLSARTYSERIIAPLARHALGWRFENIGPARRALLLPSLFLPTESDQLRQARQLLSSLQRTQGEEVDGGVSERSLLVDGVTLLWAWASRATEWLCSKALQAIGIDTNKSSNQSDSLKGATRVVQLPRAEGAVAHNHCRVTVFAGGADGLVDLTSLERSLCSYDITIHVVLGYEHMDTIWADSAADIIYPAITTHS